MASSTAEFMALFRALESAGPRGTRLFDDPYACRFLRPSLRAVARVGRIPVGRELLIAVIDRLWPGARASGVARTRLIDDALLAATADGKVEQIVLLGAGFDSRAHRLKSATSPIFFEVDRPETQEPKRARIGRGASKDLRYAPCDFRTDSLAAGLSAAAFDPGRRSFFLWEGVTNYLTPDAVDGVLRFVAATAPDSVLLFTYVDQLVLERPDLFLGSRRLKATLRRADEPWTFGLDPDRLGDFLKQHGLRLVYDEGSVDYRARYLGNGRHLRGYEFYRVAVASVGGLAAPGQSAAGGEDA